VKGTERIKQIASVSKEFRESRIIKKVLKYSFILPLLLITTLTIFVSMWVGVKTAAGITGPIEKIKEGADIVAKGKFDINLEVGGKDEIGTLVTAFNSMAKELNIAKDEIEERRRYMEVILDNVATGIISTDKKGYILLLNRAAKGILGIEHDNWRGTHLKDVFGDGFKTLTKLFLKDIKHAEGGSITKELRLNIKKDVTNLRTSLTILRDESGRTEGFIIAFDDITHIVRAEKLATWREVARKLTHEIKNPLTPIMLSAERIRRKIMSSFQGEEKDILDEATTIIIRSVDDIKGIVNELTKLTHISQTKTVEDLNLLVEETVDLYKNLYQNITFLIEQGVIPLFRVDRDGLKRALINLITNSVKALDGNEGTISVHTKYEKTKGAVVIEFADTGKGIAREDKEKIFYPYFTKDKDGTGLGLAIVHSVVLEHHGKIYVEDNVPKGTKFIIELPVIET
jgi:two-component system nitrogen regulation sensor histidine kinase NtrY